MKRIRYVVAGVIAVVWLGVPAAAAASSKSQLKLDVYPLDCVFEYVNDGSNQIVYITPEECGQQIFLPTATEMPQPLAGVLQDPVTVTGPVAFNNLADDDDADPAAFLDDTPTDEDFSVPAAAGAPAADAAATSARATVALIALVTGVVSTAVGVGVDLFVNEMAFSKAAIKWTGSKAGNVGRFIIRRPK